MAKGHEVRGPMGREYEWGSWRGAASPSPPATGSGERCKLPCGVVSGFTTFEVLKKASSDTSVVLLLLKTGNHRNAVDCC